MRVWADKLSAMREPSKREGRIRPFRDMPSRGYRSWPESSREIFYALPIDRNRPIAVLRDQPRNVRRNPQSCRRRNARVAPGPVLRDGALAESQSCRSCYQHEFNGRDSLSRGPDLFAP